MDGRKPKLTELSCSKMNIMPGDRILVKMQFTPSSEQVKNIRKAVEKWAGDGVPVLIVDERMMKIDVERAIL